MFGSADSAKRDAETQTAGNAARGPGTAVENERLNTYKQQLDNVCSMVLLKRYKA